MYKVTFKDYSKGYHTIYTHEIDGDNWQDAVDNFYTWVLQVNGWDTMPDNSKDLEYHAEGECGVVLVSIEKLQK